MIPVIEGLGTDLYDLIRKLAGLINKAKHNTLIILDEAGKINPRNAEYIHEFIDLTAGKCGLIISGPPYVRRNLLKWKNEDRPGVAEFYRRINEWIEISAPEPGELNELCKMNGITDRDWIENAVKTCESFSDMNDKIQTHKIELEAKKKGLR